MTKPDSAKKTKATKKLYIKTYGCQMNVYDSIKMQEILTPLGYSEVKDIAEADMVMLNTCHIREKAAEKVYSELGRIKKLKDQKKGDMIIIVAGCVSQAEGEEIFKRADYVDIVVGPQSYHSLPDMLEHLARGKKKLISLDFVDEEKFDNLPETKTFKGASSFISVQEGCDKFCTFCVVPYTRGAEFSRPLEAIMREAIRAASSGSKEIYLLGQNVNAYHGLSQEGVQISLAELIQHIASIKSVERIRYTTSHPRDMTDELIKLHGSEPKLMPFLHLPVQSGSNNVLQNMNRKHTRAEYFDIIARLKAANPDIILSSDFIVGFPGETDEDFADTMDLVKKIGFGACYSFKYSPRPGTPAAISQKQVPENIKAERLAILQAELTRQQVQLNQDTVGKVLPVLFDRPGKHQDQIVGKTPYMQSVCVQADGNNLLGQVLPVKITEGTASSLQGQLVQAKINAA